MNQTNQGNSHDSNWNRPISLSAQPNIGSLYVFSLDWGLATTFYLILVKIVVFFLNDERLLFLVLIIGVYLHHGVAAMDFHVSC